MINIAVPGVKGRMGAAIAQQVLQATDLQLALVSAKAGDPSVGTKFATTDLIIASELQVGSFDVLIDFTTPVAAMQHLDYCVQHNLAIVIGVTGFDALQLQRITLAASNIPILISANMSIGVNICYKLLTSAAKMLDNSWQIAVYDIHHQHKKDMPSGTAKQLAQVVANARGVDVATIPIYSERRGDVIGEHSVVFSNATETVTVNHNANTRDIFALGAVNAARWLVGREPGLYSMLDVIG